MAVLLGSKNLAVIEEVVITSSQTYTARRTGIADVICIGAGGQGGASGHGNALPHRVQVTGGGAGGYSRKRIPITAGDTFTVVIGAGGADASAMPAPSTYEDGNDGGETTFDHASATANIALDSNGGAGGLGNNTSTASGATYAGGAGGTASGGDVNFTGGRGGTVTRSNNSSNVGNFATGGGAVAMFGTGYNGGDINFTSSGTTVAATGGAGCGGNGGDIAFGTSSNALVVATSGGSAGGPADSFTATQTDAAANAWSGYGGLSSFTTIDTVAGGTRLPSHGGYGIATEDKICIAGNGGSGGTKATQINFNQNGHLTIYGGLDRVSLFGDSTVELAPAGTAQQAAGFPDAVGWGGGGGGAAGPGNDTASTTRMAAGNGAPFAGGGGIACTCDSELANNEGYAASNGKASFGGGSGGCHLGTNVSNSTVEWAGGGDGVVIIQYLG